MKFSRVKITESYRKVKLLAGGRCFLAEVYGTGRQCAVEIDELDVETGLKQGYRMRYPIPNGIKWKIIIAAYVEQTAKRM